MLLNQNLQVGHQALVLFKSFAADSPVQLRSKTAGLNDASPKTLREFLEPGFGQSEERGKWF